MLNTLSKATGVPVKALAGGATTGISVETCKYTLADWTTHSGLAATDLLAVLNDGSYISAPALSSIATLKDRSSQIVTLVAKHKKTLMISHFAASVAPHQDYDYSDIDLSSVGLEAGGTNV